MSIKDFDKCFSNKISFNTLETNTFDELIEMVRLLISLKICY